MSKPIQFRGPGIAFAAGIEKVDRAKVYGIVKTKVFDEQGRECAAASLLEDGRTLIPADGFALKLLTASLEEVARKNLVAVDEKGAALPVIPSVFDRPVELRIDSTLDDYLSLDVKAVYQLDIQEGGEALAGLLAKDALPSFDFNFRSGVECDTAFLVAADSHVFAVVGAPIQFEFLTLDAPVAEEAGEEDGEDPFDFGML